MEEGAYKGYEAFSKENSLKMGRSDLLAASRFLGLYFPSKRAKKVKTNFLPHLVWIQRFNFTAQDYLGNETKKRKAHSKMMKKMLMEGEEFPP